ncbi:MAG: alkene reductase [Gammaproteobacteria bacterium]|nr:alkene reductase [Gammaproteobacteria bacterium]
MTHYEALFTPLQAGSLTLSNRILMAPLTRCRAEAGHLPSALMATHYAQRATAGLIIAEATMVMEHCSAFWHEPGIYNQAQVEGWRHVTDAVHAAGGVIVLQLWHGGRACHPLLNDGRVPVSASALAIANEEVYTPAGKQPYTTPRALEDNEIPAIISGFAKAASNAKAAGFDGVELHGANGYLLDQFLRDGSNQRQPPYGGSRANRARLLLAVLDVLCDIWGNDRVGLRLSPLNSFNDMRDSDPIGLATWLAGELNAYQLAYLHLMRADFAGLQQGNLMEAVRSAYQGVLIGNMGYSAEEANSAILNRTVDAVAFGTAFIANPDLPARFAAAAPLNTPDPATFYTPGAAGYTDYPNLTS